MLTYFVPSKLAETIANDLKAGIKADIKADLKADLASVNYAGSGDSPVMASGGSMTFRSTNGWSCDTPPGNLHQRCVVGGKVDTSTIEWDDVVPLAPNGALGWTNLQGWTLDIYARDASSKPTRKGYIEMCTTSSGNIATTSCDNKTGFLLISTAGSKGVMGQAVSIIDSNVLETTTAPFYAVQYYDPGCQTHNGSPIPACEHPGFIHSSIDNGDYICLHGKCQILVDK